MTNSSYFTSGKLYRVCVTSGPIVINASDADKGPIWKYERRYLDCGEILMFLYEKETPHGPKCFFLLDTDIIFFKGKACEYLIEA